MATETQLTGNGSANIQSDSQHGVIGSWWQLAIGMTESSCSFGFGIAQDTRAELRRRTDVTLTFVEDISVGTLKFVRRVIDRVDGIAAESLGRGEAAVLVATRTLRRAGHGVTDLASNTLSDTIGSSNGRRPEGLRSSSATA
ncbi:MAG TPA: hypothetical protein VHC69_06715 [Polyangiaceae bacterium]|nr:hypothetical protein [Polyangiaceae bacterium]